MRFADDLIDLALGGGCAGCGRPGRVWCPGCASGLAAPVATASPALAPSGLPPTCAVARYDGAIKRAILAYKERGRSTLARPLGSALGRAIGAALRSGGDVPFGPPVAVVPVPSRADATRTRGYDALARLVRVGVRTARRAGFDVVRVRALCLTRDVADQAELNATARMQNVRNAFGVRPGAGPLLADRPVLIVDDVVTSGATLVEARRALVAAGGRVLGAAVIAATSRSAPPGSRGHLLRATPTD